jgi:hypothetical protein
MPSGSVDTGAGLLRRGSFLGWLVERHSLTPMMAERVARVQAETSGRLVAILLKLGLLSESCLADALAGYCELPRLVSDALPSQDPNFPYINKSFLLAYEIVPLRAGMATVELACWDALDDYPSAAVKFAVGRGVSRYVATRTQITTALGKLYGTRSCDEGTAITADDLVESAELAQLRANVQDRARGSAQRYRPDYTSPETAQA